VRRLRNLCEGDLRNILLVIKLSAGLGHRPLYVCWYCFVRKNEGYLGEGLIPPPWTPFHALLFVSIALTLINILVDCDRTSSSMSVRLVWCHISIGERSTPRKKGEGGYVR